MEWRPPKASFLTVSGVAATRVSPGRVSPGMPMFMSFSGFLSRPRRPKPSAMIQQRLLIARARGCSSYNPWREFEATRGGIMTVKVRRVVTGHDGSGRAVVKIDEVSKNIVSNRPGASGCVVWTTDTIPAGNSGDFDGAARKVGTTLPGGTVFRVIEFSPGVAPRVHRTDSIDYAVVISGEIDMELEKGTEVHLKAGDVLVQRGTVHNWINRGKAPCVIAFVLVDAKPAAAGGKTLNAFG